MPRYVSTDQGLGRLNPDSTVSLLDIPHASLDAAFRGGSTVTSLRDAPAVRTVDASAVRLGAPVRRPTTLWLVGYAYADHSKEVGHDRKDEHPIVFLKASSSVAGPREDIQLPALAPDFVDFEGEIAVVIGERASSIAESEAWDHVLGLTAANDVSARDVQRGAYNAGNPDPSKGKGFDTFTPLGPSVCTVDEYPDPDDVGLSTTVDGELRQQARSRDLVNGIPRIVSFVSSFCTLSPGDVILTGTPAGVGHPAGRFLRAGSVVRVEVEGAGAIENRVVGP